MTNWIRPGQNRRIAAAALCATTVGGFLWLPPAAGFQNPALARIVVFHVPCSMVAYLASGRRHLVRRPLSAAARPDGRHQVPRLVRAGLVFWALTTVTGAIFAKVQWGAYWNWDIKQGAILMLLLIYVAYFALRAAIDDPRKQATVGAAYASSPCCPRPYLTYVLPNSTPDTPAPEGHTGGRPQPANTAWSSGRGVLGLCLVYCGRSASTSPLETVAAAAAPSRPTRQRRRRPTSPSVRQGNSNATHFCR